MQPHVLTILAQKLAAPLLDRYLARTGYDAQQTGEKVRGDRSHNLWQPVDGPDGHDHGAHGAFDATSHSQSPQLWLSHHPRTLAAATATAAGVTAVLAVRGRR